MKRTALALGLGGVLLLATWVQAPAAPAREIALPMPAEVASAEQTAQTVVPVSHQIDEEAERLRQRLAAQVPFAPPVRDPFRFSSARVEKPMPKGSDPFSTENTPKGSDPIVLNIPVSPAVVVPTLIGLTEDVVEGVTVRTAVLSMDDEMAMVKVGQPFARFVVKSISATSVELVDVTSPKRDVTTITIR